MEPIQKQVTLLTQKVDALHQLIDQVNIRVSEILSTTQSQTRGAVIDDNYHPHVIASGTMTATDSMFIHKDILMDSVYLDRETANDDHVLSPEVQIQRLTAQLTAAYNRIAALEEQLLANRAH